MAQTKIKNLQLRPKVISNQEIADKIFELKLSGKFPHAEFEPGKFLHIRCNDSYTPVLRRPMSICNINAAEDTLTVLYRQEGAGTSALAGKQADETIDMLAPLGEAFPIDEVQAGDKITLVGGGIGVPPLYYLGQKLKAKGAVIKSILGFNAAKDVFYAREFQELGEVVITTIQDTYQEEGIESQQGLVTDVLTEDWDKLYSCGPTAMLKALQNIIPTNKKAYISLEERMGCGIGACLACYCDVQDEFLDDFKTKYNKNYARICHEGPVFGLHEIKL